MLSSAEFRRCTTITSGGTAYLDAEGPCGIFQCSLTTAEVPHQMCILAGGKFSGITYNTLIAALIMGVSFGGTPSWVALETKMNNRHILCFSSFGGAGGREARPRGLSRSAANSLHVAIDRTQNAEENVYTYIYIYIYVVRPPIHIFVYIYICGQAPHTYIYIYVCIPLYMYVVPRPWIHLCPIFKLRFGLKMPRFALHTTIDRVEPWTLHLLEVGYHQRWVIFSRYLVDTIWGPFFVECTAVLLVLRENQKKTTILVCPALK